MEKLPYRVTLSEALSWLAFGVLCDKDKLKTELVSSAIGLVDDEALRKLTVSLQDLTKSARSGQVKLEGRYMPNTSSADALTKRIEPNALADFRAFDILLDGLRLGEGILWMSNDKMVWVNNPKTSLEHYRDITMNFKELRDCLKAGSSPTLSSAKMKSPLSQAALQQWWQSLPAVDRKMSQVQLLDLCKKSHPDHRITRQMVRDLTGSRKTGPKPIRPK